MGQVYLAASPTGLKLAVKVVRVEHAEDRAFRARFRHEVRAAQAVGGAGLVVSVRITWLFAAPGSNR